jgi:hypothetical protein
MRNSHATYRPAESIRGLDQKPVNSPMKPMMQNHEKSTNPVGPGNLRLDWLPQLGRSSSFVVIQQHFFLA